jgi:hypothetical protein
MIRGFAAVEVMTPKEGPELTLLFGLLKFAVFVRLKNSARTWMLWDSAKGNPRSIARSMFLWAGPRTKPSPLLPKSVSAGFVANGAWGAEVKASAFRYLPTTRE